MPAQRRRGAQEKGACPLMKRSTLLRLLTVSLMILLLGIGISACKPAPGPNEDTTAAEITSDDPATQTPAPSETDPVTDPSDDTQPAPETIAVTEPVTERETYTPYAGVENAKTINLAGTLANKVTAYYPDASRREFVIENANAKLIYLMCDPGAPALVGRLENTKGMPYLTNTLDTFLELGGSDTFYASGSTARANVYDQGYYYYDVHLLGQNFTGPDCVAAGKPVNLLSVSSTHDVVVPKKAEADGSYKFVVQDPLDPYFCFKLNANTAEIDAVMITMSVTRSGEACFYWISGSHANYSDAQRMNFSLTNDGEFHTYLVPIARGEDFNGTLSGLRLDVGNVAKQAIYIKEISLVKMRDDTPQLTVDRDFVVYSDKMNDVARFLADSDLKNITGMGTELRIPADTVQKLIVSDCGGLHDKLSEVDWPTAEYIGFDVKDAGIFGYILLAHETSGTLSVELKDGEYVLRQSYVPKNGEMKKNTEVFVGHRLYTDESHDFAAFVYAADCERNPLTSIRVAGSSKSTYYKGYDALRGIYEFIVQKAGGFGVEYDNPGAQHNITFEIDGDEKDRPIYVMAHVEDGSLECAAVLDEYMRMLPIRVEVSKNFAHDGEELYFTYNDSIGYGFAIYPMVVEANNTEKMTVCHLYERWGQYRVKQLSSIRFHQAYYHMSTGVTETNCIAYYNRGNRLPDHRGMSQAYWGDVYFSALTADGKPTGPRTVYSSQPQHENNGSHSFLTYTDADGKYVTTENVRHHIDSSGPTYMDLTMYYVTTDGKIDVSLRHMEMPQYDENRGYYELDYRVRESVQLSNFRNDLSLYSLSSNSSHRYVKLGYLDENNQSVITDANNRTKAAVYTLGSEFPYVSYFHMADPNPMQYNRDDVYSNVSYLIKGWDIVIGGAKYEGPLCIVEKDGQICLTLDLGAVTLQPGDYIHVDLILMPWGDNTSMDDENVRLVRENTLIHPITASSEKDVVMEDVWMAKVRSANGASAEFTISGGCDNTEREGFASKGHTGYKTYYDRDYNVTVRVYGLHEFGTLGLYELIDGAWTPVETASEWGYDGYAVLYDEDNTFSYSFVINMNDAQPRTFRVVTE